MFNLLNKYNKKAIILSGDVHFAEILKDPCNNLGYSLYELTSSGMSDHYNYLYMFIKKYLKFMP